ncbi:hypothetical protein N5079_09815 [Planotetraspora sp. A-T 1434]|uniref:hypothetical protein n=1 Tax=Planotetraspora sp. A-T 1434 TaxID=2979219 RepID=UPI0021C0172E|nr:hypothetical protein [Planotetraspora sp. A-T 1434]MCT9930512.1 hypothetical protein [Planotetraspora sp. A-T 1434]
MRPLSLVVAAFLITALLPAGQALADPSPGRVLKAHDVVGVGGRSGPRAGSRTASR